MKRLIYFALAIALIGGFYFAFFYGEYNEEETEVQQDTRVRVAAGDSAAENNVVTEIDIKREEILKENARPEDYIELEYEFKKNLLGETTVEGKILNKANHTRYRDFQVMMYFVDEYEELLDSTSEIIFGNLMPGSDMKFDMKEKGPRKSKKIMIRLMDAKVVDE